MADGPAAMAMRSRRSAMSRSIRNSAGRLRRAATTAILAVGTAFGAGVAPAVAHGFGQRYDLPLPLWLYLFGTASAVIVSFLVVGLLVRHSPASDAYPRFNLLNLRL